MGTDVHAYVDYDEVVNGKVCASNLARVYIARDYWLFSLMAGVRSPSIQGQSSISKPKGLPTQISWRVQQDAYLWVLEDSGNGINPGCCSREEAERYGNYTDETKRYIHHPDWHSHTWLTLDEVDEVISRYSTLKTRKQVWLREHEAIPDGYSITNEDWCGLRVAVSEGVPVKVPMEIRAIRSMMATVESNGYKSRLIAWFDN